MVHPDELDQISTSGDASSRTSPAAPASAEEVMGALKKILASGRLRRIPKKARPRDIVLATLCLSMQRRHPYTELELNEILKTRLHSMLALVDHATCRRYLVDLDFLKRDRAGTRYFLNYPRIESALSSDARTCAKAFLEEFQGAGSEANEKEWEPQETS